MCFRFPIEQTTFGRYCVLLALQMLGGFVILACVAVTLSFFVSVCIYLIAFVRNYEVLLDDINAMASTEDINQIDCKVKFTQIVQYHNEIYELGQLHSCNFTSNAVNTHFCYFPPTHTQNGRGSDKFDATRHYLNAIRFGDFFRYFDFSMRKHGKVYGEFVI